ncbi:MAG: hypothetical protein R6T92_00115 [Desulfosalsimonadaceae bacterium]
MEQDQKVHFSRFFFDQRDHDLLLIVNEMIKGDKSILHDQRRFFHHLHPRGIKEMAESKGLRIAYAVIHLLESLQEGQVDNRICALRALRDEVMCSTDQNLQINTARVLIEIMKDLVRAADEYPRQLELAHDFRLVASGKPRIVRFYLKKYRLLEMPEEWNQLAFDDHVHDANTKGRKSATHLIMDAWIKGIRRLRVIYYNFIRPETAEELMEASSIMGIDVRIGIEFPVAFHSGFAQIIWVPRGFADAKDFIRFLSDDAVDALMNDGGEVSDFQRNQVVGVLEEFNRVHRPMLGEKFGIDFPELDVARFLTFVGIGQASLLHLAQFIHRNMLPAMQSKVAELRNQYANADMEEQARIEKRVEEMDRFDMELIHDFYLKPASGRKYENHDVPHLMKHTAPELIERLDRLRSGYRITLNLTNMKVEDVLELIYDCKGRITRLEIFNLKDHAQGIVDHIPEIHKLQRCINTGNVIKLKRIITDIIDRLENDPDPGAQARVQKMKTILAHIESLKNMYKGKSVKARMGSDSTGYSPSLYGMGLAVMDSLPRRARRSILCNREVPHLRVPFHVDVAYRKTFGANGANGKNGRVFLLLKWLRMLPFLAHIGLPCRVEWVARVDSIRMVPQGNITTLGGIKKERSNGLFLDPPDEKPHRVSYSWRYLQTRWKNLLKVLIGFTPAFLTFLWSHDGWLLMYFGAFIWFGITGLRNIIQSVVAGGGIRRSSLLKWNDFISWDRLADSLMFTGFSVPLLDYLVKTVALDRGFGVNTETGPVVLYSVMALANGIYLTSHNLFRGLPKEAAFANFFRSALSIPVAFGLNAGLGVFLGFAGVPNVAAVLQSGAAVISKFASDFVAGFIEGAVDRAGNIKNRMKDYRHRLEQFFGVYAKLEMQFPEKDVYGLLDRPGHWFELSGHPSRDLIRIMIINSLDLLYFWMYQPRARTAFRTILAEMPPDERCVIIRAQKILTMEREISQMFIDGIAGRNFSRPLAFYLAQSREYLDAIEKLNASFEDSIPCTRQP